MKRILPVLLFLLLLTACAGRPTAPARLADDVRVPAEARAVPGTAIDVVGLVLNRRPALLVGTIGSDGSLSSDDQAVLVLSDTALLDDIVWRAVGTTDAAFVEVRGTVRSDGGVDTLAVRELRSVPPQATTLAELATLSGPRLVELDAHLLAAGGSLVLVSRLSDGGVPTASSLQIKMRLAGTDPTLLPALRTSGAAAFGPVTVVGMWRDGVLTGLMVTPRADS